MRRLIYFVLCFLLVSSIAYSKSISIEKKIKDNDISIGDDIQLFLEISNPFSEDIQIQIQDKNIISGNGLDIQCYELTLPKKGEKNILYDPIKAFEAGNYELEGAKIIYINPESGKEETIESNPLKVKIKDSSKKQDINQQGITTIYQCGGTSIKSTSYSSQGSSFSVNINQGFNQPAQTNQNKQSVQQSNQDIQSLKEQLQQQVREQEEMKKNFQEELEKKSEFQELENQLKENGYEPINKDINPESEKSGVFNYEYENQNGEKASISGKMEDGTITEISKWDAQDQKTLQEMLENNREFQKMKNKIGNEYHETNKSLTYPSSENKSSFNYQYENKKGDKKVITGEITKTGNITSINLEQEKEGNKRLLLFGSIILIFIIVLWFLIKKYFKKKRKEVIKPNPIKEEKPFDFIKESLKLIKKAEGEYNRGNKEKGYVLVSKSLRIYFKYKLESDKEEMTSSEIIKKTKSLSIFEDIRECFNLCDLVKFAKYRPNKKDFKKAVRLAKKIIES